MYPHRWNLVVAPADALLSLRRAGIEALREDRADDPGDIVDAPET
ncbi:hypothetical protein [Frankia gtarii]|nr:hypothetical protein [Frankia gtarii]